MRTQAEILNRLALIDSGKFMDPFGVWNGHLVMALPYEAALPFLTEGTTSEEFNKIRTVNDGAIIAEMLDYMPFAWGKANDFRGLSAARTMDRYGAWLWLLNIDLGEMRDYEFYGKPNLIRICDHFGWDASQWDDGVHTNHDPACW